jgi:hypothetical protein
MFQAATSKLDEDRRQLQEWGGRLAALTREFDEARQEVKAARTEIEGQRNLLTQQARRTRASRSLQACCLSACRTAAAAADADMPHVPGCCLSAGCCPVCCTIQVGGAAPGPASCPPGAGQVRVQPAARDTPPPVFWTCLEQRASQVVLSQGACCSNLCACTGKEWRLLMRGQP